MDYDVDVILVVEGRCAAIKRGIIEVPFRRSDPPNELRKVVPVFVVAGAAAFGGKIILVPPLELSVGRQRSPIKTGHGRLLDFERIHEGDGIESERRRLAIAECSA